LWSTGYDESWYWSEYGARLNQVRAPIRFTHNIENLEKLSSVPRKLRWKRMSSEIMCSLIIFSNVQRINELVSQVLDSN